MKKFLLLSCLIIGICLSFPTINISQSDNLIFNHGINVHDIISNVIHNTVRIIARHANGQIFFDETNYNLRTYAGINWQYNQMAGTTAAVCTYIALSNTAITPALTDTTLSGEITSAYGLQRALGTVTHTSNATYYVVSNQFTNSASGTQSAQAIALFNNTYANGGTMCFENTFTQVTLNPNDTITPGWTVNF